MTRHPDQAHFRKNFQGSRARVPIQVHIALAVTELLAFNAQIFTGLRDPGHAYFYPLVTFRGWQLVAGRQPLNVKRG